MLSQNLPLLVMLTAVVATRAACGDTSSRKVRGKRLRFGCPPFKVITKLTPRTPCSQNHDRLFAKSRRKGLLVSTNLESIEAAKKRYGVGGRVNFFFCIQV